VGGNRMAKSYEYIDKWKKGNVSRHYFYVNKNTESDVDEWLNGIGNKRQYLIGLIRKDMDGKTPKNSKDPASKDPTTTEEKESGKKARKEVKVQI